MMTVIIISSLIFIAIGILLALFILFAKNKIMLKGSCVVRINDNSPLEAPRGENLLEFLSSNGHSVPSACGGGGSCATCKVRVVTEEAEVLEIDKAHFSIRELSQGWRLSCQHRIRENIDIKLDTTNNAQVFQGKVVSNNNVATFIKELIIEVAEVDGHAFIPGDYFQFQIPGFKTNTEDWKATMESKYYSDWEKYGMFGKEIEFDLDEEIIRAYSCGTHPKDRYLKFIIRIATPPLLKNGKLDHRIPWGMGSSFLFSLKENDLVDMSGAFGESHMIYDEREVVFLIGGAGMSFGYSHISDLLLNKKSKRKISFWYGARSLKENFYESEFKFLQKNYSNFSYQLVLSEPAKEDIQSEGWDKDDPVQTNFLYKAFKIGYLDKLEAKHEEPDEKLYYVCGPPAHNSSVMQLLKEYGVDRELIILDDFGS